jgi:SP family general alpha glucoside:H+ symporter-like MFS transporter
MQQGANIGSFFGIIMGAFMVDKLGYKKTILANLVFMCPFIGLVAFAPNKGALLAGEILCGLPWGVFSTLAEAYASEVCPLSLRGYLTTWVTSRRAKRKLTRAALSTSAGSWATSSALVSSAKPPS